MSIIKISALAAATDISATDDVAMRDISDSSMAPTGTTKRPSVAQLAEVMAGGAYNIKLYGAKGDGTTDDTIAIASAITAAGVGGHLYAPAGTYIVNPYLIAEDGTNSYYAAIQLNSGQTLRGAGRGSTIFKLKAGAQTSTVGGLSSSMLKTLHPISGTDKNITISDCTFDGNGINQGSSVHHGVSPLRVRGIKLERLIIKNFRGTNSSGWNESFHQDFTICSNASAADCECLTDDGSSSASGFSANGSTNVMYVNCSSHGMTVAMGYTHYGSTNIQYVNCNAYLNTNGWGFNSEESDEVIYTNCVAGGIAGTGPPPGFSSGQSLGNSQGFVINGTLNAVLTGCIAKKNAAAGISFVTGSRASVGQINGGVVADNAFGYTETGAGINGKVRITGVQFVNNTTADLGLPGGYTAYVYGTEAQPAQTVPANNVSMQNQFPMDMVVYIAGGTVSAISVGWASGSVAPTGLIAGTIRVPAGAWIKLNYTVAPTWHWFFG